MRRQVPSPAWTWLAVLLVGVSCTCRASVVTVNMGLRVKRGQVAYLQKEDLQFHIPHEKDVCKVEVVKNEPITQRVGELMPQVVKHLEVTVKQTFIILGELIPRSIIMCKN